MFISTLHVTAYIKKNTASPVEGYLLLRYSVQTYILSNFLKPLAMVTLVFFRFLIRRYIDTCSSRAAGFTCRLYRPVPHVIRLKIKPVQGLASCAPPAPHGKSGGSQRKTKFFFSNRRFCPTFVMVYVRKKFEKRIAID